jgi:hypothetical protein
MSISVLHCMYSVMCINCGVELDAEGEIFYLTAPRWIKNAWAHEKAEIDHQIGKSIFICSTMNFIDSH